MNLTTRHLLRLNERGNHAGAHTIIADEGRHIASSVVAIKTPQRDRAYPQVTYHKIGDDVVCVLSWTQIQYAGSLSHPPYWKG